MSDDKLIANLIMIDNFVYLLTLRTDLRLHLLLLFADVGVLLEQLLSLYSLVVFLQLDFPLELTLSVLPKKKKKKGKCNDTH